MSTIGPTENQPNPNSTMPPQPSPGRAAAALSLRMVPLTQLHLHEAYHPPRVDRLSARLAQEHALLNPPIVAEVRTGENENRAGDPNYVVLDGATRVSAFRRLGYPHIVVQVVEVENGGVQLLAWHHAVRDAHGRGGVSALLRLAEEIPGVRMRQVSVEQAGTIMEKQGALSYLITNSNKACLLEFESHNASSNGLAPMPSPQTSDWLDVLNAWVDAYGEWGDVERVLSTDVEQVQAMHVDAVGIVAFPSFTPEKVLQLAVAGRRLPAGITRFVIPGRILRLNAPLEKLRSDETLEQKQRWLDAFVAEKLNARRVRYYDEPVMLLDE